MADHNHSAQIPYLSQSQSSDNQAPPNMSTNLADDFYRLSIAAARSISPLPPPSPTPDRRSPSRASSRVRNVSSSATPVSSKGPALRKTPSTASLRDERRLSTPGLQKRASTTSLRSSSQSRDHGAARPSLSRRSSSNLLGAMYSPRASLEAPIETPTASSIAAEHFQAELRLHESVDLQSKTMVVIQDACYGHRYSRPYTSKEGLATIVERPERLRASVLGLSTAYIRVGKRHAGSAFAPRPDLDINLLPPPPFQIRKSNRAVPLDSPAVTYIHGDKWMGHLKTMCNAAESRLELNGREIVRPRSAGRKDNDEKPLHDGDLYLCPESLDAFQGALGGVCDAVDTVLGHGTTNRAFVCIRPPGHHCSSADPSGFCWLNNVHVGIAHAAMTHGLTHAAIIDFDLHHGDGSQAIAYKQNEQAWNLQQRGGATARNAAQCKKTVIGYYSLHDINSFPCENGEADKIVNASVCIDNAHGQSIWNVHLEPWKTHDEFWKLYNDKYVVLLEKARNFLRFHTQRLEATEGAPVPKAAIFVSAGFDASEFEGAGMQRHKVNVPTDFYARFTTDIVRLAEEEGLGTNGRIISVLEGGYSNRALSSGVLSHLSALADARSKSNVSITEPQSRLALEMSGRLGLSNGDIGQDPLDHEDYAPAFETDWWATNLLEELETLAFPPPAPPIKKSQKSAPTFFSPTQASTAKVVTPSKERKLSATSAIDEHSLEPLPEVDWATSAYELWKCLIPNDRETMSFQYEDLKARAALAKKKKMATPESPATPSNGRRQLRARTSKTSSPDTPAGPKVSTPRRVSSRNSRRTTIGTASDLPEPRSSSKDQRRRQSTTGAVSDAGDAPIETGSKTPTRSSSRLSTAPSQSPAGVVAGRKPRVSSGSRTSTPKRAVSSDKVPPLPKVPSLYMNNQSVPSSSSKASQSGPGIDSNEGAKVENDIDEVSAGVKKLSIKLKVPSPEENARREKKATEQRKKPATNKKTEATKPIPNKTNRGTAPKTTTDKKTAIAPKPSQHQPQSAHEVSEKNKTKTEFEIPIKIDIPSEPARFGNESNHVSPMAPVSGYPELESYQGFTTAPNQPSQFNLPMSPISPLGFPSASTAAPMIQQPEMMAQPSSAAPTRQNLPVFTSTSPIPFASPGSGDQPTYPQGTGVHYQQAPQGPFLQQINSAVHTPVQQQTPDESKPNSFHWAS